VSYPVVGNVVEDKGQCFYIYKPCLNVNLYTSLPSPLRTLARQPWYVMIYSRDCARTTPIAWLPHSLAARCRHSGSSSKGAVETQLPTICALLSAFAVEHAASCCYLTHWHLSHLSPFSVEALSHGSPGLESPWSQFPGFLASGLGISEFHRTGRGQRYTP